MPTPDQQKHDPTIMPETPISSIYDQYTSLTNTATEYSTELDQWKKQKQLAKDNSLEFTSPEPSKTEKITLGLELIEIGLTTKQITRDLIYEARNAQDGIKQDMWDQVIALPESKTEPLKQFATANAVAEIISELSIDYVPPRILTKLLEKYPNIASSPYLLIQSLNKLVNTSQTNPINLLENPNLEPHIQLLSSENRVNLTPQGEQKLQFVSSEIVGLKLARLANSLTGNSLDTNSLINNIAKTFGNAVAPETIGEIMSQLQIDQVNLTNIAEITALLARAATEPQLKAQLFGVTIGCVEGVLSRRPPVDGLQNENVRKKYVSLSVSAAKALCTLVGPDVSLDGLLRYPQESDLRDQELLLSKLDKIRGQEYSRWPNEATTIFNNNAEDVHNRIEAKKATTPKTEPQPEPQPEPASVPVETPPQPTESVTPLKPEPEVAQPTVEIETTAPTEKPHQSEATAEQLHLVAKFIAELPNYKRFATGTRPEEVVNLIHGLRRTELNNLSDTDPLIILLEMIQDEIRKKY